ncbi:MAG: YihY/virulence factor BrkB family protein [Clostridia bacterium]|nr:YihY/virulence factor BrkB family protein [Clostridia bacterium]
MKRCSRFRAFERRLKTEIPAVLRVYSDCMISRSAAGLSYYLLLSLFPMIVCFSIIITQFRPNEGELLKTVVSWIANDLSVIEAFTWENPEKVSSITIFTVALVLLLSTSAGAFRCLSHTSTDILHSVFPTQLVHQHRQTNGMIRLIFSYVFSIVLFFAVYISIFLMVLWDVVLDYLIADVPVYLVDLVDDTRYGVLLTIFFCICYLLQLLLLPRGFSWRSLMPGALFSAIGMGIITAYFSVFIRGSAKYSLVYGSLASIVLMLMWIFMCGNLILIGTLINVVHQSAK